MHFVPTEAQQRVCELIATGHSVFFTGAAGTGKTALLKHVVRAARRDGRVAVTATTGAAAVNVRGCTLHAFSGIGVAEATSVHQVADRVAQSPKHVSNWLNTQVLIIDEVSMLSASVFSALEFVAREIRENSRVFGGMQVVLCGDFTQLPPVSTGDFNGEFSLRSDPRFCFESEAWHRLLPPQYCVNLSTVFRQKDASLISLLHKVRFGVSKHERSTVQRLLEQFKRPLQEKKKTTRLFCRNRLVDEINEKEMAKITGEAHTYRSKDSVLSGHRAHRLRQLQQQCVCSHRITLKVGAHVMLLRNDEPLVNGSTGVVIAFRHTHQFDENDFDDGVPEGHVHETKKRSKRRASSAAVSYDTLVRQQQGSTACEDKPPWPVVRFQCGTLRLVRPARWEIMAEDGTDEVVARRYQVPLKPAYAISVHKSQGLSLSRLRCHLSDAFEHGHVYVALSRATCPTGLHVLSFDIDKIICRPEVIRFYSQMGDPDACAALKNSGAASMPSIFTQSASEIAKQLHETTSSARNNSLNWNLKLLRSFGRDDGNAGHEKVDEKSEESEEICVDANGFAVFSDDDEFDVDFVNAVLVPNDEATTKKDKRKKTQSSKSKRRKKDNSSSETKEKTLRKESKKLKRKEKKDKKKDTKKEKKEKKEKRRAMKEKTKLERKDKRNKNTDNDQTDIKHKKTRKTTTPGRRHDREPQPNSFRAMSETKLSKRQVQLQREIAAQRNRLTLLEQPHALPARKATLPRVRPLQDLSSEPSLETTTLRAWVTQALQTPPAKQRVTFDNNSRPKKRRKVANRLQKIESRKRLGETKAQKIEQYDDSDSEEDLFLTDARFVSPEDRRKRRKKKKLEKLKRKKGKRKKLR